MRKKTIDRLAALHVRAARLLPLAVGKLDLHASLLRPQRVKFCEFHWAALRMAISDRGLSQFVAGSGAEVSKKLTSGEFEPLMSAHMAIVQRLIQIGGLSLMMPNEDGSSRCPICFANEEHKRGCTSPDCDYSFNHFIERAADAELATARQLGLVATN